MGTVPPAADLLDDLESVVGPAAAGHFAADLAALAAARAAARLAAAEGALR